MNNIYKVIWSKAKNCYVVASEIARSHTKSASGSEKIGGVTRRSLLASLMALSLLCGGLGVAEAAVVHVDEVPGGTKAVYTTDETYTMTQADAKYATQAALGDYAKSAEVYSKTEADAKYATQTALGDYAKSAEVYSKTEADAKYATQAALGDYAKSAEVYSKTEADAKYATQAALGDYAKSADVYSKTEADGKFATQAELNAKADVTALGEYAKKVDVNNALSAKADKMDLDTANGKITDLQKKTAKLSADGTELTGMTTVSGATVSGTNVEAGALKVTGEISNGAGVTTTLTDIKASMDKANANETAIGQLQTTTTNQQTAIDGLNKKTTKITYDASNGTSVDGVTFNAGAVTGVTSINGTEIGTKESGEYIHQDNSIWGNMKKVDTQVKTNADAIAQEKTDRENAIGNLTEDKNYIKKDKNVSDNLVELDKQAKTNADAIAQEKTDRENAIGSLTEDKNYIKKDKNVSDNLVELDKQAKTNADAIAQEKTDRENAIGSLTEDKNYIKKDKNVSDNLVELDKQAKANADEIVKTNERTGGITRNPEKTQTTIEGAVKVDNQGNVKDVKGLSAETITTGALNVTGASDLKGDVILGTNAANTVTVNGTANFNAPVNMDKGLNVTNGETKLQKTTVDGNLKVTGTITTDKMVFGDKATNNYTEIDKGHITSKNDVLAGDATKKSSSMELDHSKLEVGVADKDSNGHLTMTADQTSIKNSDLDEKNYSEIVADKDSVTTTVKDEKGNTTSTKSSAKEIRNYAKDKDGNESFIVQTGKDITNTAEKGTITNTAKDIVNNATGDISNTANNITNEAKTELTDKVGTNTRVIDSNSITDTVGTTTNRKIEDGKITDTAGDFTVTTEKTKGTTFAKTGSTTAFSTEAGAPTDTNIAGNLITTGRVDANELGVSDKDGDNTADFSVEAGEGKGVKASAGNGTTTGSLDVTAKEVGSSVKDASGKGSTFKQRIDKIMMESKDVSIKAEETLTNEAKVITNKASEVINNEAVNINNTATGIITSKASEIKNQADKLISNKVGENTWENMEDGKITTSIKDGAKQNLTQSDAAGTTQSTVDDGKSTVTIQNADGLVDVVTDETNTSVQNQTASQIATDVKDRAGNENASVANATISANTIKSGSKANTVISTADGTSFINSEAAAPVTGASGAGTAVNTTIKGNTITTGKVTMDYAEVMKDLGVHGNANIGGKTTTGSLEVKGESKLTGNVTMENNATVGNDLIVKGITTTKTLKVTENAEIDGNATIKGDVTARSYKVGDKTYIDANGIHANGQKITDVADGSISEGSKDAVNGGQLYGVKRDLEHQVDKVGANAAAMANLRPMEFDPSSKWNIAAAIGNYGSETAAAIGAFYRPNDDVMVNLSTAFGTGENMVGGGVSVRLGKSGNKLSREENNALKDQVNDLTARMDALLSVLNPNMSKDFPDVPENHWAYEAVSRLAGNDIVQGYPDGEFHGERTMTRYEMAEIIYNALSRGAEAERELVEEFKPELQAMAASEKATAEKAEG